jgi:hypothetical protein
MVQGSNTRLGQEQGRETLLQNTAPENALSFVIAFIRLSCLADLEQTQDVEQLLERSCRRVLECYSNGTFNENDLKDLLNIWRGRFSESTFQRLVRRTNEHSPQLSASAAFAFGCKYARAGDRDVAKYLFEYALSCGVAHPLVEELARRQLEKLASPDEPREPQPDPAK